MGCDAPPLCPPFILIPGSSLGQALGLSDRGSGDGCCGKEYCCDSGGVVGGGFCDGGVFAYGHGSFGLDG